MNGFAVVVINMVVLTTSLSLADWAALRGGEWRFLLEVGKLGIPVAVYEARRKDAPQLSLCLFCLVGFVGFGF